MGRNAECFRRKNGPAWAGIFLLLVGVQTQCVSSSDPDVSSSSTQDSFLGFDPPVSEALVFAPNLISTDAEEHSSPAIAPDGSEIYWSVFNEPDQRMEIKCVSRRQDTWSNPATAPFSGVFWDDSPAFSPDGTKLYFCSKRPDKPGGTPRKDQDIWMLSRRDDGWGQPERLSFNTDSGESWCSVAANGNLYFTAVYHDSLGKGDIYMTEFVEGVYSKPRNIGEPVNGRSHEMTPYVTPDENTLIFASTERYLGDGLYLSFRRTNGSWTEPVLINNLLSPYSFKRHPGVSPDGRFLFYVGRAKPGAHRDIYWIKTDILDEFRSRAGLVSPGR